MIRTVSSQSTPVAPASVASIPASPASVASAPASPTSVASAPVASAPVASAPGSPTELTLSVELQTGSECGLLRAFTLLHRRRCHVLEARYSTAAGADRLTLRIQAPPRHAHCVEAWLSALVDVRAVATESG